MNKIYFAAPWFTAAQLERETRLIKKLRDLGFDVFSPRESSNITGSFADKAVQEATFRTNLDNIDSAEILFAVTDGKQGVCTEPDKNGKSMQAIDPGTMFEVGYAFSKKTSDKPLTMIYYAETLGNAQFNLMLARSADIVITDFEALDLLPEMIKNKSYTEFEGEIE